MHRSLARRKNEGKEKFAKWRKKARHINSANNVQRRGGRKEGGRFRAEVSSGKKRSANHSFSLRFLQNGGRECVPSNVETNLTWATNWLHLTKAISSSVTHVPGQFYTMVFSIFQTVGIDKARACTTHRSLISDFTVLRAGFLHSYRGFSIFNLSPAVLRAGFRFLYAAVRGAITRYRLLRRREFYFHTGEVSLFIDGEFIWWVRPRLWVSILRVREWVGGAFFVFIFGGIDVWDWNGFGAAFFFFGFRSVSSTRIERYICESENVTIEYIGKISKLLQFRSWFSFRTIARNVGW